MCLCLCVCVCVCVSKCRLTPLKLSNITNAGYIELHGMLVKVANTRRGAPYVVRLQERVVAIHPSDENKHALQAVAALNQICEICYGAGAIMTRS